MIYKIVVLLAFLSFSAGYIASENSAEVEFEQAWNNPQYTQIKLDDVNINETLERYYDTPVPVNFTRTMLWDMESKKAWNPKKYIRYVVRDGKSWGKKSLPNGDETFVRSSQQKQWLNPNVYEDVFEEVYLNNKAQKATFLGRTTLQDESGKTLQLKNQQPLFHVQHSVAGEENQPLNVWRIVFLTEGKDQNLIDHIKQLNDPTKLPGFVEIYIEDDLNIPLSHK